MRPDILLECGGRLLVLDAKFKTYAENSIGEDEDNLPLTADINQCHAYRDGILRRGIPCVQAAWLLYPGRVAGGNRATIGYAGPEVGAILLRPQINRPLANFIMAFLQNRTTNI